VWVSWAFQVVGECVWACVGVVMVRGLERQSCGNDVCVSLMSLCVYALQVLCAPSCFSGQS
jgi:hypothetical protein